MVHTTSMNASGGFLEKIKSTSSIKNWHFFQKQETAQGNPYK